MSGPGDDGPPRPLRGRHQLTRSISEFTPPLRLRQLRHHEHESLPPQDKDASRHRRHQHHHSHHHRHHRRHESSLLPSGAPALEGDELLHDGMPTNAGAAPPQHGRASLDMTRSEFATPLNLTPSMSRAASVLVTGGKDDGSIAMLLGPPSQGAASRNAEELLREEKEKAALRVTYVIPTIESIPGRRGRAYTRVSREKALTHVAHNCSGLQKSLGDLGTLSGTTTQRLDEMYYSVLEKTSMLQNTVAAMKELAGSAQEVKEAFDRDAVEVVRDAQGQLNVLGQFEDHERQIQAMQGRIQAGRSRLEGLSARVDIVKGRVEGWERADLEWQERTRKRLRRVWIVISVLIASVVLMAIGARLASTSGRARPLIEGPDGVNGSGNGGAADKAALDLGLWEERKAEGEDELRFLDEL